MFALKDASSGVLSESVPVEQMDLVAFQIDQFWASPWWMHLLGVLERVFAITMHIFMALLVQRAVLRKELRWLWAAVLFHTLIDMVAVYGTALNVIGKLSPITFFKKINICLYTH